jgi:hypothetical protein
MFATLLYYMVGLADRESAANFFVYLSLLFVFALLMNQQLAVFASFASAGGLNAYGACIVLLLILFCGFIVVPDTIPMYYSWIYWWNRKLIVPGYASAMPSENQHNLTAASLALPLQPLPGCTGPSLLTSSTVDGGKM